MPSPGQQIGPYTIDRAIARGRSGTVYRAVSVDGRVVALKLHDRPEAAASEIACLRSIRHAGVVDLVDSGQTAANGAWLALGWVEGQTLAHLFATEGPLSLDQTRRIVAGVASAIDALHRAGYVHGDLAPSNILVDGSGEVTVVDLATAAPTENPADSIDTTVGIELETTPLYASPEVAQGNRAGPASDIYALALVAYQALTGESPFADVATPIAMLHHHASSVPVPIREHRPDVPGDVEDALLQAMAKAPADRPSTATEFSQLINRNGHGEPLNKSRSIRVRRAALAALAIVGIAGLALFVRYQSTEAPLPDRDQAIIAAELSWTAGDAARSLCNLVVNAGFEGSAVPDHYYFGDETNTTELVPGAGVGTTTALRLGANGAFGIFGEIVPINPDEDLVLSAWMRVQGEPEVAAMYVDYLAADYQRLTAERALPGTAAGTPQGDRFLMVSKPPPQAAFAVPTFFKDASGGSLLIDEVIFGPQSRCLAGLGS